MLDYSLSIKQCSDHLKNNKKKRLVCWLTSIHRSNNATFWVNAKCSLHLMYRYGKLPRIIHAFIYEWDVFLMALQLQRTCSFIRTISPPAEVAAPGAVRLCRDAHIIYSHECQHAAEQCMATRWSWSLKSPLRLIFASGLGWTGAVFISF